MTAATAPWELCRVIHGAMRFALTEVIELRRDTAQSALSPTDFEAVALAVGFA